MITSEQIRAARKAAGLTQKQAAELLGLAMVTWKFYENGRLNMPARNFELFLIKTGQV